MTQAEETKVLKNKLKNVNTAGELIEIFNWAYQETLLGNSSRATCFRSVRACLPDETRDQPFVDEAERRLEIYYMGRWRWTGD